MPPQPWRDHIKNGESANRRHCEEPKATRQSRGVVPWRFWIASLRSQ
jgi:hypothetical protein